MIFPTIMELTPYEIIHIITNNLNDEVNEPFVEAAPEHESEVESDSQGSIDADYDVFEPKRDSTPTVTEKMDNITTIYSLGNEPQVGDIIRFSERSNESEEDIRIECANIKEMPPRCISTYNQNEVEPYAGYQGENGELYVVVSKTNLLPNPKGYAVTAALQGDVNLIDTENVHLLVEPLVGLEMNESVFWYINYSDLTVRQFEGGAVNIKIDNLEIIGHEDGVRRSSAPSPESQVSYSDSDSDYQPDEEYSSSEPSEIDYGDEDYHESDSKYESHSPHSVFYRGDPNFNDGDY